MRQKRDATCSTARCYPQPPAPTSLPWARQLNTAATSELVLRPALAHRTQPAARPPPHLRKQLLEVLCKHSAAQRGGRVVRQSTRAACPRCTAGRHAWGSREYTPAPMRQPARQPCQPLPARQPSQPQPASLCRPAGRTHRTSAWGAGSCVPAGSRCPWTPAGRPRPWPWGPASLQGSRPGKKQAQTAQACVMGVRARGAAPPLPRHNLLLPSPAPATAASLAQQGMQSKAHAQQGPQTHAQARGLTV